MQLKPSHQTFNYPGIAPREDLPTAERPNDQEYNYQYYEEYKRLYQTAFLLSVQLKQLAQVKDDLWLKLGRLDKKTEDFKDDIRGEAPDKKKRFRRTAEEIERPFVCQVDRCQKCYGSQGSLQQHTKIKHPELYDPKAFNQEEQGSQNDESDD